MILRRRPNPAPSSAPPPAGLAAACEILPQVRLRLASLHHRDDGPIAAMAGPVIACELRRIEPGRYASVEKEGIAAAEAVTEKTGKLVKVHPSLSDDEMHLGRARYADAVPRFAVNPGDGVGRSSDLFQGAARDSLSDLTSAAACPFRKLYPRVAMVKSA
jgi:hypothetical protein